MSWRIFRVHRPELPGVGVGLKPTGLDVSTIASGNTIVRNQGRAWLAARLRIATPLVDAKVVAHVSMTEDDVGDRLFIDCPCIANHRLSDLTTRACVH